MSFAFVFPGQGSQSVGMLVSLAAAEPLVQETFAESSEVLGYDLWNLCQQG
ncbi:MAG: ACP S-malonyltransferase, partial [Steroidobacteraceae bacterium]